MGIRRPPTRRHTPVTPTPIPIVSTSTSPDDSEVEMKDEIIVDSDDNFRTTPQPPGSHFHHTLSEPPHQRGGLSIVEFKDITPKFRGVMVGFPVEIQLELQTRLRNSNSSHFSRNGETSSNEDLRNVGEGTRHHVQSYHKEPQTVKTVENINEDSSRGLSSASQNQMIEENEENSTFDFHQRKKSYELESFDSHAEFRSRQHRSNSNNYAANYLNLFPPSKDDNVKSILDHRQPSRSSSTSPFSSPTPSRWGLYNKPQSSGCSAPTDWTLLDSSSKQTMFRSPYNDNDNTFERSTEIPIKIEDHCYNAENRQTDKSEFDGDAENLLGPDNYLVTSSSQINLSKPQGGKIETENSRGYYTTTREDVGYMVSEPRSPSPSFPTSLERSRKLLQMLDETPSVLPNLKEWNREGYNSKRLGLEGRTLWDNGGHGKQNEEDETEWQTQRQLSFLNDSLSRILDSGRIGLSDASTSTRYNKSQEILKSRSGQEKLASDLEESEYSSATFSNREFDESEMDINGNLRPKLGQVSQTWISSGDLNKPSQKVRDMDVTTSISATHDHFKRGAKKVEFCKTEVHFTADSGKFHIVETDENKPSTSHLFRRKKKDRSKIISQQPPESQEESKDNIGDNIVTNTKGETDSQKDWANTKTVNAESEGGHNFTNQISKESPKLNNSSPSFYDMLKNNAINESQILDLKLNTKPQQEDESPSHNILSEYEEMKIQRYLTHLKSPSFTNSSPLSSSKQMFNFDVDEGRGRQSSPSNAYRFNNVLYENGSFVPLATRRSLIEMHNNNKQPDVNMREKPDNRRSVSSTPNTSLQPPQLARLEATVTTARPNPQITSVRIGELRYELDSASNATGFQGRHLSRSPSPPASLIQINKKESALFKHNPSVEVNQETYSSRSDRISDLIKRSYYKNPELDWTSGGAANKNTNRLNTKNNNLSMSTAIVSSTSNNKSASRSIVTIGDYDTRNKVNEASPEPSPEPLLSMDHTWKGPAYIPSPGRSLTLLKLRGNNELDNNATILSKKADVLFNPFSSQKNEASPAPSPEPEWILKARNREHRIKDWESVGKQQGTFSSPSQPPDQPPWLDDFIRPRSKTSLAVAERVPKVSVVYPWQRQTEMSNRVESFNLLKSNNEQKVDHQTSQIVSIIPSPYGKSSLETTLGHSRGPKSLPDLPVLTSARKNEISDRGSMLAHSSPHVRRNRKTSSTGLHEHFLPDPPTSTIATPTAISSTSNKNKLTSTDNTATTKSVQNKLVSSGAVSRRSKQTVESTTPTGTNMNTYALKEGVIRRSGRSTNKSRTENESKSANSEPFKERNAASVGGGSQKRMTTMVGKESPTSTATTTTVHRHPLVKVSKLPIRKNLPTKEKVKGKGGRKENPGQYKLNDKLLSISCRLI